ncbi:helix-turn-helix transcriptional regulator [Gemmiger sp. An120]|uniref:helix-turn-helix domain-containing protein n=1 Tax=Gemmiger sp. An120 TaxID=1965549 RepID=UPI000B3945E3|nr:helix-turn-helix transcriptional regulator [Gemmiger sp. An120]
MTNRETPATIGQRILALRRTAGMSQEALAAAVGVSRQALGKWEADQSLPGLDNLLALAEALHTSCDELLTGRPLSSEQPPAPSLSAEGMQALLDARETRETKRRRISLAAGGGVALVLAAALLCVGLYAGSRMDDLQNRIDGVNGQVAGMQGTLQAQVDSMTNRVQTMLDEQNSLAAGESHSYSEWESGSRTLLLTARVTAKQSVPGASARLIVTATYPTDTHSAVTLEMTDEGGGVFTVSGRVATADELTATFQLESPDGTVQNQQLWSDYAPHGQFEPIVELGGGIDGQLIRFETQNGQIRFDGDVGLSLGATEYAWPVEAEMQLEIGGQVVETFPIPELYKDFVPTEDSYTGDQAVFVGSTVTYFWTPQAHPWKADQSVIITARVVDSQGNVYERQMELIS